MKPPDQNWKIGNAFPIVIAWSRDNWYIIRFCLLFFFYITGIYLLIQVIGMKTNFLSFLCTKVAQLSSWLLILLGMKTQSINSVVFQPQGFAIDITYKCTGILQIAFFIAGVFAYPCLFLKKLSGIIIGIPLIFSINLIRIVSLFLIGVIAFPFFDFAHKVIGEVLMIFVTLLTWLFWLKRMSPPEAKSSEAQ